MSTLIGPEQRWVTTALPTLQHAAERQESIYGSDAAACSKHLDELINRIFLLLANPFAAAALWLGPQITSGNFSLAYITCRYNQRLSAARASLDGFRCLQQRIKTAWRRGLSGWRLKCKIYEAPSPYRVAKKQAEITTLSRHSRSFAVLIHDAAASANRDPPV